MGDGGAVSDRFETGETGPVADPEAVREALRADVIALASLIHAAEAEMVALVARMAGDEPSWGCPGYLTLGHWLGVNAGFTPAEAARRVRIAERTGELPALTAAAGAGRISVGLWDRATAVATAATDEQLADLCHLMTPAQVLRTLATFRRVADANADDADPRPEGPEVERTWLRKWWDDQSRLHVDGCLDAVDGALFETALDAARAAGERDAADATARVSPVEAFTRMSDLMLDDTRATGLTRDGTHFAVEVTLDATTGACRYGTVHLSDAQAAEIGCDCRLHHLIHDGGVALNHGRDVRTAPRALRRALRLRDGGCAFPGCHQTRFVHAHHITYWEHGGPTDLDNMVLLCRRHHRLLHHGGYTCDMGPDRRPRFADPNGHDIIPIDGREPPVVSPLPAWWQRQRKRPVEATAARARSGGEPLTAYALDIILHTLLTTTNTAA